MAYEKINTGATPNDGTGDSLRDAGKKINDNLDKTQEISDTSYTITGAGWIKIAKLNSGEGRGTYSISVKIQGNMSAHNALIYIDTSAEGNIADRIDDVNVINASPLIKGVGLIDSDSDNEPWLYVKMDYTGSDYNVMARFKSINELGLYTPSQTSEQENLTMHAEFLFPVGNTFKRGLKTESLVIDRPQAITADILFSIDNVARWIIRRNDNAESGSNAGSDLSIIRRADDGSSLGTALEIRRSDGHVGMSISPDGTAMLNVGGTVKADNITMMQAKIDNLEARLDAAGL